MNYADNNVLHWSFGDSYVLLPILRMDSTASFIAASLFITMLCFLERLITFASDAHWRPSFVGRSKWQYALWRSGLYWITTFLRLLYMLCAMSFHVGLLLVIVTSLAAANFFFELRNAPDHRLSERNLYSTIASEEPLSSADSHVMNPVHPATRPRSKSKPDNIFIHPNHSNLARADAAAMQLGLGGPTERVSGSVFQAKDTWETGKGREAARALLGHARSGSQRHAFNIGGGSDSESDT